MIEPDSLILGDCLDVMQEIPDGSVDMVLCDLPYGVIKGAKLKGWTDKTTGWDNKLDTKQLFSVYSKKLKEKSVAVLFSQEPYTHELRCYNSSNFYFKYPMIWKKNHFANPLSCNKAPVSYFEDISIFGTKYDINGINPLRQYFKTILKALHLFTNLHLMLGVKYFVY